jgi:hypothetical protein
VTGPINPVISLHGPVFEDLAGDRLKGYAYLRLFFLISGTMTGLRLFCLTASGSEKIYIGAKWMSALAWAVRFASLRLAFE